MAHLLKLPTQPSTLNIAGVGNQHMQASRSSVVVTCRPTRSDSPTIKTTAYILNYVTGCLPLERLPNAAHFSEQLRFPLADLDYHTPAPVDLLLGSDVLGQVLDGTRVSLGPGKPIAFGTIFDFALLGPFEDFYPRPDNQVSSLHVISPQPDIAESTHDIQKSLERFWESEEPHSRAVPSTLNDQCEQIFSSTTTRQPSGQYMVTLPFLSNAPSLGNTHAVALRRFLNLERKLQSNPALRSKYIDFMNEYRRLGHMSPCHPKTFANRPHFYIPHHGVFKSCSDKLRVVFDGSCRSSNAVSLNDCLHTGPALQLDIVDILMSFRTHPVVFSTDIKMMFRNILIHPDQRQYQLILWRSSPNEPLLTYSLNTVTYGLRSSPYHAIRTILQLVNDDGHRYPAAAQVLRRSMFVDDILSGHDSIESAQELQNDLISLLALGGFQLSKWTSNSPQLLERFPDDQCDMPKDFDINSDPSSIKVLGVRWIPQSDMFTYHVALPSKPQVTKRSILSTIASLYDPSGWVTPVIFRAKLLLQRLWLLKLGWDEPTPPDISSEWESISQDLTQLSSLRLSRHICTGKLSSGCSLHGFSDASESGFAATVYLRELTVDGHVHIHLILAKSKVAPIKNRLSIPKLELSAAALLSQLMSRVSAQLSAHFPIHHNVCWSDSTIVLAWLNTPPHRLQVFEANRVAKINSSSPPLTWRHVPTDLNPADCASRGMSASALSTHHLWWSPSWLKDAPEAWPRMPPALGHHALPGLKPKHVPSLITVPGIDIGLLTRFSALDKLVGVTACIRRFISNCRLDPDARRSGVLSAHERKEALLFWVCSVQHNEFSEDIHRIKTNKLCSTRINRLTPFLKDNLLRVGGRLSNASLTYSAQHPLILPSSSPLTDLIIDHYHRIHCHPGADTLHSILRQQFWILSARRVIRHRVFKCIRCFRCRAQPQAPIMADLPPDRVTPQPVFSQVTTDFAGPFLVRSSTLRNAKLLKAYFCIFVCLSTRAVHLEPVSALTTEAFFAALQRFVSRRGAPSLIRSDCGTNYVGARNHLIEVQRFLETNNDAIAHKLARQHITWLLNVPKGPWFGALHEINVKSAKQLLYRVIGEQRFTFEEFSTLLARIEAVLNSRPICPMSSDPSDFEPLTAGHFLIGRPLTALPEEPLEDKPLSSLRRFQLIKALSQRFWTLWTNSYLHTLQTRSKWLSPSSAPRVGELVLIKEDNLPPLQWRLGRIIRTIPGKDGVVRVVDLDTATGHLRRPVFKIARLPLDPAQDDGSVPAPPGCSRQ
ncbi:unnamed protein product [Arctia plantaginis]|uniref:Integrase catalytic domain-containing protein n=1 Tax=Arctia plantaginis TaxID=874455 RepID=A0A8S0ZTC9_ARCPL|nr:unnamed protein product [Arctia plantaginis]